MSDFNGFQRTAPTRAEMATDAGLRAFMLGVYNKMGLGLLVSGAIAWAFATIDALAAYLITLDPLGRPLSYTALGWAVVFAPVAITFASSFLVRNPTARTTGLIYWAVVVLMGASLGVIGRIYTGESIASMLLVTAIAFGGLSLFGYATKANLGPIGSFLIMGAWGLVAAWMVNIFWLKSGEFSRILSGVGVVVFAGLIATKTQFLKLSYYDLGGSKDAAAALSNYGALMLYISFVNLFLSLLRLFGSRR